MHEMPLYKKLQLLFQRKVHGLVLIQKKPDAFMRTASSFEGHENHKFSVFFCLTLSEKS
jgi:hypothetical protein